MGVGSRVGHTAAGRNSLRVGLQSFRRQQHTLGRKLWEWNARGLYASRLLPGVTKHG
jgi:hypothetical protein